MRLTDIISRKAIVPTLKAKDKKGIIAELVAAMKKAYADERLNANELLEAIISREETGSTGLHGGVAIPHSHYKNLHAVRGAFGRSNQPIDFRAVDGEPTYLFFAVVAPPSKNDEYLSVLRTISTAIRGSHFCKFLRAAKTVKEIEDVLRETEETPART